MPLTRRKFLLMMGGSSAAAVVFQACGIPDRELLVQSPLEMPEDLVTGVDNWYATLCRQCSTSEGIIVRVMEGRAKKVQGNSDYPINQGKHSARCEAALQALYHPDRISSPKRRVNGEFIDITWQEALETLGAALRGQRDSRNTDSVVLATNPLRGHLGKLVDRFIGVYGGQHMGYEVLEQTVLRRAVKEVFKQDMLPDFDIPNTRYLLSFGGDFLGTWLSPVRYARGYGEFRQGNRPRGKLVQVESRFSMTAANADERVYIKPGTEGFLALSMAHVIISEELGNADAARAMTDGQMAAYLENFAPDKASTATGVSAERIAELAREFANQRPSLAIGGGSAAAHTNGLFNLKAILALNFLVDSVGKSGGIIFNPEHPLADVPAQANVATFSDWIDLVKRMAGGQVNVLMLRGIDPVYGIPGAGGFKDALAKVSLVASFSSFMDDTAAMADLILPEHTSLESWGDDVPDPGPGYQTVGFQQPVVRPFFEKDEKNGFGTRAFGDVILALAEEVGIELPWETFRDVLEEGAQKLHSLGRGSVKASSFAAFWNGVLQRGGWWDTGAQSKATAPSAPLLPKDLKPPTIQGPGGEDTFNLVPFASLSMTDGSGAHLPWLQATPDPMTSAVWQTWIEINTRVAKDMDIREGEVVRVESSNGSSIEALAYPHPGVPPDVVSIPIGQGHTDYGQFAKERGANVLSILALESDVETGALAWASTRVRIKKTGRWIRLPKFEGSVPAFPAEEAEIIQITS